MCIKKIALGIGTTALILGGIYYGIWRFQSSKMQILTTKFLNETKLGGYNISYTSVYESGFPFSIKTNIENIKIYKTNEENKENNNQNQLFSIKNLQIDSDIFNKKFLISLKSPIEIENFEGEINNKKDLNKLIINYKPYLEIIFKNSPLYFTEKTTFSDILNNFSKLLYKNKKYEIKDEVNNASRLINTDDYILVTNSTKDNKSQFKIKIDSNNTLDKAKSLNDFTTLYADLTLDFEEKKEPYIIDFDITKIKLGFGDIKLDLDGKFFINFTSDFIPLGEMNISIVNYKEFFKQLAPLKSQFQDISFFEEQLPKIANKFSNDEKDIFIKYERKEKKQTMIGTKSMEELLSQYYLYSSKENKENNDSISEAYKNHEIIQ